MSAEVMPLPVLSAQAPTKKARNRTANALLKTLLKTLLKELLREPLSALPKARAKVTAGSPEERREWVMARLILWLGFPKFTAFRPVRVDTVQYREIRGISAIVHILAGLPPPVLRLFCLQTS
jgi:hypothetical protein